MNSSDQIQARRDEIAKWIKELAIAKLDYDCAVAKPHVPGQIDKELAAIRSAHERICQALFKIDWLKWEEEITDEERARYELG